MSYYCRAFAVGLGLALICGQAWGQAIDPSSPEVLVTPPLCPSTPLFRQPATEPGMQLAPAAPAMGTGQPSVVPDLTLEARSAAGRGEAFALAAPAMIGDFAGFCARNVIAVPVTRTVTTQIGASKPKTTTVPVHGTQNVLVCDPLVDRAGSGFKVADDESPCPQDRVFITYNYFDHLGGIGGFTPGGTTTTGSLSSKTGLITTVTPTVFAQGRTVDVDRELFGFEKTFLAGDASVELRVPIFQTTGDGNLNGEDFGDITVIVKYAFLHDPTCGRCLTGGLALTIPTGPGIATIDGTIHDVLFQPYLAGLWTCGDLFVQGFSSFVVPTDSRDVTLMFNDMGVGYTVYHGSHDHCISFVAPSLECHVTTPLDHRSATSALAVKDLADLTPGVYVGIGERMLLSFGMAFPVLSAQAFDYEALVQLSYRF